jgi:hypothetical protein
LQLIPGFLKPKASRHIPSGFFMSDTPETPKVPKRALTQAERRAARLQSALRDNLRRRKAAGTVADNQQTPDNEKAKPNES